MVCMMVKRGAEEQISEYTDFEKLESQDGNSGTWEKASSEELAKRRIVKIKRPSGNVTAGNRNRAQRFCHHLQGREMKKPR